MELFEDLFLDPSAVLVNRCPANGDYRRLLGAFWTWSSSMIST